MSIPIKTMSKDEMLATLDERIAAFETEYGISSDVMWRMFSDVTEGTHDVVEWMQIYRVRQELLDE